MASSKKIGVIAEDRSDVAVIKILVERLRNSPVSVCHFVGNGCGKIIGKSAMWSRELVRIGCKFLLIVHDLDRNKRSELELKLRKAISNSPIAPTLILIPIQEIEAWLLSDEVALSRFFNLKKSLKRISNPEAVNNPKEKLARLVYQASGGKKRYVNAIHNERIAGDLSLSRLRTCPSFLPLENFVKEKIC